MHVWMLLLMAVTGAPSPEVPAEAAESRRALQVQAPTLIWEDGRANAWTTAETPPGPVPTPRLGTVLFGPNWPGPDTVVVHMVGGGQLLMQTRNGDMIRITGHGSITLARTDEDIITLQRDARESPAQAIEIETISAPPDFVLGRYHRTDIELGPAMVTTTEDAGPVLIAPRSRAIRPTSGSTGDNDDGFAIVWRGVSATRFDLEINEIDANEQVLATTERWWRIAGPSFQPWHPLEAGRRYRISLAISDAKPDDASERAAWDVDTLSNTDLQLLRSSLEGLALRRQELGWGPMIVLEAIIHASFGLDDEAARCWWLLFMTRTTHPRAAEFAARAWMALR